MSERVSNAEQSRQRQAYDRWNALILQKHSFLQEKHTLHGPSPHSADTRMPQVHKQLQLKWFEFFLLSYFISYGQIKIHICFFFCI